VYVFGLFWCGFVFFVLGEGYWDVFVVLGFLGDFADDDVFGVHSVEDDVGLVWGFCDFLLVWVVVVLFVVGGVLWYGCSLKRLDRLAYTLLLQKG
jgi:hypothetical protein